VCANGKTRPVQTIPGMENGGGVNSTMIYCKKFCKCYNVPLVQKKKKKERKKRSQPETASMYFLRENFFSLIVCTHIHTYTPTSFAKYPNRNYYLDRLPDSICLCKS
jgi:hypothetical protein